MCIFKPTHEIKYRSTVYNVMVAGDRAFDSYEWSEGSQPAWTLTEDGWAYNGLVVDCTVTPIEYLGE